ncbi:MAG: hypothetical protein NZ484_00195 [Patescibacteria group bacterium]|nr:hypothetical protein [Patescibacteria group bacterium]MCX7589919.1 hypothetical protein [Patescibacteria group bacterium]MDW8279599.1 hypothetical protein [bacterium]
MDEQKLNQKINDFIQKIEKSKREDKMDLSSNQDLSIAIMNLISIEEHFFFTGAKTGKTAYYDLIKEVREIRKELLKKIVKDYEGEVWCISKHLLAASYRLMEVGTKKLGENKNQEAYDLFDKAYLLYSIFWGINLKILDISDIKKIDDGALNKHDNEKTLEKITETNSNLDNEPSGAFDKLKKLIKKAIDCCIE